MQATNKIFILSILISLFMSPNTLVAQDCEENLEQARRYYQIGQIEKVPGILEPCMEDGFDKNQKSEAYELLVLTNQYDNKPKEAEEAYISLLKHDPEYTINEANAPSELLRLYQTYHAPPVYSIGFLGGVNIAMGQRIQSYGLSNAEENLSEYSNDGLGFQVGLTVERYISKSFELNLDFIYKNVRFERTLSQLDFANILYVESQDQFNIPLTATYDLQLGRLSPYVRAGAGLSIMFNAEATLERVYQEGGVQNLANVTGPNIEMLDQRNPINFYSVIGGGIKYKVPRGVIILDFRHNWNFIQQNRTSKRYENNTLVYEYHYIDDDFKLGNMAFSLGYTYSFHKIKLVKNKDKNRDTE